MVVTVAARLTEVSSVLSVVSCVPSGSLVSLLSLDVSSSAGMSLLSLFSVGG